MKKYYLVNIFDKLKDKYKKKFKKGKTIHFEMPPFCSGDYTAKIYEDENGLYIKQEDNFFNGARDFDVR